MIEKTIDVVTSDGVMPAYVFHPEGEGPHPVVIFYFDIFGVRDEIIRASRRQGRRKWKRTSGYHRRSVIETQLCRYKQLIGRQLRARCQENQETEARLGCAVLNRMMRIAKPVSYPRERGA